MPEQLPLFDRELLEDKLADLEVPGFVGELDPEEAEHAGAFREEALSEEEALQACPEPLWLFEEPST